MTTRPAPYPVKSMRPLLILVSLLCVAPAWAEGEQADDEERPGARSTAKQNRRNDGPNDSDTPEQPNDPAPEPTSPPAARDTKALVRDSDHNGVVGERSVGDSPVRSTRSVVQVAWEMSVVRVNRITPTPVAA